MMTDLLQSQPVLVGQGGSLNGYRWYIADEITIGRTGACEITIPNQQVSRKHARIFVSPDGPALEDLAETAHSIMENLLRISQTWKTVISSKSLLLKNLSFWAKTQLYLLRLVILNPQSSPISGESVLKKTRIELGF